MTLPQTLVVAARSGKLHGSTLAVLIELHEWIGTDEYRTVKAWCIAERLHVDRAQVYRALATLLELGYVEQGEQLGTARTYRLRAVDARAVA